MKLKFKNLIIKIKCFFCNCMKKEKVIDFQSSRKTTNL